MSKAGPSDARGPGVLLEEFAGHAGGAVCLETSRGPAVWPLAGVREKAQVGGWRESGVNRWAMRRLCEFDKAVRA